MVPKGWATSRVACAPWWLSLAWQGPSLSQRPCKFAIRSDRPPSSHTTKVNISGFAAVRFASAASKMPKRKSTHAEKPAVAAPEPRRRSMRLQRTEDETEPKAVKNEKASKADIKTEEVRGFLLGLRLSDHQWTTNVLTSCSGRAIHQEIKDLKTGNRACG